MECLSVVYNTIHGIPVQICCKSPAPRYSLLLTRAGIDNGREQDYLCNFFLTSARLTCISFLNAYKTNMPKSSVRKA